jgi:6-phosphogluconolactonase
MAPGSGPRHLAFHPRGDVAYLIHELDSTIGVLGYAVGEGRFRLEQVVSTLPAGYGRAGNAAAEVAVHPSGRFVSGSNRGHDSIAVFAVGESGHLTPAGHVSSGGRGPRHFAVDPGGRYLVAANQHTDNLAGFRIDPERGTLTPLDGGVEVPAPVCVRFWSDG